MAKILRIKNEKGEWISVPAIKGEKGDPGPQGEQGIQGLQGEDGVPFTYKDLTDEQKNELKVNIATDTFDSLVTEDKTLLGAMNELFTDVSNGKELVANAITDKGVDTSSNDTFATMAENISNIDNGYDFVGNMNSYHRLFQYNNNYNVLTIPDIGKKLADNSKNVKNFSEMFYRRRSDFPSSFNLEYLDLSNVENNNSSHNALSYVFGSGGFKKLPNIINSDNILSFYCFFSLDVDMYLTEKKIEMSDMKTSSATDMRYMFSDNDYLTDIIMPHFDSSNVKTMYHMFDNCYRLKNLPELDTTNVTSTNCMFANCHSLDGNFYDSTKRIFNLKNVTDTSSMIGGYHYASTYGCTNSIFDGKCLDFSEKTSTPIQTSPFHNYAYNSSSMITEIIDLDITWFYRSSNSTSYGLFSHSSITSNKYLSRLTFKMNDDGTPMTMHYTGTTNGFLYNLTMKNSYYNHDSMVETINTLPYTTGTCTIRFQSAYGGSELTDEELTVAIDRGWTITLI